VYSLLCKAQNFLLQTIVGFHILFLFTRHQILEILVEYWSLFMDITYICSCDVLFAQRCRCCCYSMCTVISIEFCIDYAVIHFV